MRLPLSDCLKHRALQWNQLVYLLMKSSPRQTFQPKNDRCIMRCEVNLQRIFKAILYIANSNQLLYLQRLEKTGQQHKTTIRVLEQSSEIQIVKCVD